VVVSLTSATHAHLTQHELSRNIIGSYIVWLMATRTAKLLPHLWHRPQDIIFGPAFILFGYYFAIMKVYALLTLHEVRYHLPNYSRFTLTNFVYIDWMGYPSWYRRSDSRDGSRGATTGEAWCTDADSIYGLYERFVIQLPPARRRFAGWLLSADTIRARATSGLHDWRVYTYRADSANPFSVRFANTTRSGISCSSL
jgi:hypothetical protein